jgi:uncharacterized repeat protein (TIGR01451 family)
MNMNLRTLFLATLMSGAAAAIAFGQMPPHPPSFPAPSPLLFVRLDGPAGLRMAFALAPNLSRQLTAPAVVGLRLGYIYQFELAGLPARPGLADAPKALYPTIEVRGSLMMPPGINPANFPAPVVFTAEDIAAAQAGSFITKVIFCECPDQALPEQSSLARPLEIEVRPTEDPVHEARERGRLVAVVRFGAREASAEELLARTVPGTILFPGEKALPPPSAPPVLPWACWPTVDPVLGRKGGCECVCDGGDRGLRAGLGPRGELHGLDPADTVAEYTDSQGQRHIACSNPVCIFAPRFAIAKSEITPSGYSAVFGPGAAVGIKGQLIVEARTPPLVAGQNVQPEAMRGRRSPSGTEAITGTVDIDQFKGTMEAVGRMNGATVTGTCVKKVVAPDRPLLLCKSADRPTAQVGDIVTFQLKYTNVGGQPITDVVVSDSLTNRLEYVAGSFKSDREATFTTQSNEVGSAVLRWQVAGTLQPGQSGVISFQARVR